MRKIGTVTLACVQMFAASGIAIVSAWCSQSFLANHQDSVDSVMGQFLPYIDQPTTVLCIYIIIYICL